MRIRVGLDAREGFRENPRGIGLYCRHLMREFGAMQDELEVLAYHERPQPPDLPELAANIHARRCEMKGSRLHLWEKLRMPWQMRRDRVQVYHGTYNTLPPRWTRLRCPAMVVSLHDVVVTWWDEGQTDSYVDHVRKVTGRVCREADKILTVSEFSKRDICERFAVPESKVEIFYNGIPPVFLKISRQDPAKLRVNDMPKASRTLFSIGSPIKRKNTRGFIDALQILASRKRLDMRVVISGLVGEDLETLRSYAQERAVDGFIDFHGYLSHAELAAINAGAELMVYPSFAEGWGIPVLESFAMGTPVAASRSTSIPEAGGDDAEDFDPENAEEMAEVILASLDRSAKFASRRDAAKLRARGFTWRAAAEKTLAVYREVC